MAVPVAALYYPAAHSDYWMEDHATGQESGGVRAQDFWDLNTKVGEPAAGRKSLKNFHGINFHIIIMD